MKRDDKAMLYSSQALDDRRSLDHNQAMLDAMTPTAKAIKSQLEAAYEKWDGSGGPKTKKRLAALCQAAVKNYRKCTPQAVNGWFQAGRIDKYWLPVVSSVLGSRIGVLVDLDESDDAFGLQSIFSHLAELLQPLGGNDRKKALAILEDFAMKPEDHKTVAIAFAALLGGAEQSPPSSIERAA